MARRPQINQLTGRLESLQRDVGGRVVGTVGEVGRQVDRLAVEVTDVGRAVATLPADAVRTLVRRAMLFLRAAVVTAIFGAVMIALTTQLSPNTYLSFLAPHKTKILMAEIGLFGIGTVELVASALSQFLRSKGTQHAAFVTRVSLRTVSYSMLVVGIVSVLAASPALAVGVGSVTGLIIGLSAQATVGNAVAGTVIAIARPFRIGDEITVMGVTGRVVEIGIMHTILDTHDRVILVPSATLMTQVVQRQKASETATAPVAPGGPTATVSSATLPTPGAAEGPVSENSRRTGS